MKLEDVVAVNLVDHHPQNNLVHTPREMAAKIITNKVIDHYQDIYKCQHCRNKFPN
ncbi:MAG: hypothetical protein ABF804_09205 [Liquorilactobacillus ghanensis]|uniref:hypothetical protein n=1 Tax=Liquorilactobacillus ghanensis TaxID=399370 RepID=UPI0039E7C30B